MTRLERLQAWAKTPAAKRVGLALRILFFGAMILWLVLKVRAIGWREVVANLPTQPLFYLLFVLNFLVLPLSETVTFRLVFGQRLPGALPVLIRKRILNSALVGYSGELYLMVWLRRTLSIGTKRILLALKDNAILSAVASGVVTAGLLVLFALAGNARKIVHWLDPTPALVVAALIAAAFLGPVLYRLRRQLIALPARRAWAVLGINVGRIILVLLIQATQWAVVLPNEKWSTWLIFLTAQMVISRLPIVPNRDLLFLSAGLELSNSIAGPRAAMAGMLLAGGALTQGANLLFFAATALCLKPAQASPDGDEETLPGAA